MKKIICYFSEENNCVLLNEEPGAMSMYLTADQVTAVLKRPDFDGLPMSITKEPAQGPMSSTMIEELIALKKAGFTSAEIIELKQSKLL
tara:strand:- start:2589 stop:2855 length:267 start_codon:yes stop_codon:yes gene_type:complete